MKKLKIYIILLCLLKINLFSQDDIPTINLPKIELEIEDKRKIEVELKSEEIKMDFTLFTEIEKPEFTSLIKVDLEKTLPERVESPDKQKPVDAIVTFGYGLNNNFLVDFSIFIKDINPQVSIKYLRDTRETAWIEDFNKKNQIYLDDLKSEIIFSYKKFFLGSEIGYFSKSLSLQDKSIFSNLTKRVINFDVVPSLKFNYQNDLSLRLLNSLIFNNAFNNDSTLTRNDFAYLLNSEILYSQVFSTNHFINARIGYEFNYQEERKKGSKDDFKEEYINFFYNNIKAGIEYSTIIKDSFLINAKVNFLGFFKNSDFLWFILPFFKFGYNYFDYFSCYIEGGGDLIKKVDHNYVKENDYIIYQAESTPGYKWYGKTGISAGISEWFSVNNDFEVIYNMWGNDWKLASNSERLWMFTKRDYLEINLYASISFTYKKFIEIKSEWIHYFYERGYFEGRDSLYILFKAGIPKSGLEFFIDFIAKFLREDNNGNDIGNIYLMNAGIDWNFKERFGLGIKFNNILYFQKHTIMPPYEEPGFEFIAYIKIGF